ncbi:serine palmitoyltransferase [Marinoscillum sp.]|uniref:serine palmitoyltransferase n=1 Tax=Marinoscillum sp. TaxID=2024838 RepID=UPI003BA9E5C8
MNRLRERTKLYTEPQRVKALGYYPFFRKIESEQGTVVKVDGRDVLMFGSNSYLGLTNHPKVIEAGHQAMAKYGAGCAGSRFLNGTLDIHEELEQRLARFLGKEAVLMYSTGFQVNLGVIPCLTKRGDFILMDEYVHASIIEGARLSLANTLKFRHNDMESLEKKLKRCPKGSFKLIVVDGIFSMEGDITKLPEVVRLAQEYEAVVMTDCAHAIGVIGDHGAGTPSHFGLTDEVQLIGGTFSKSLASLGGFIASDQDTINFLKHHSRSMIFSASITPASCAAALAALDIIESDDSHRLRLWENTNYALKSLKDLGFDTGSSETPIIPIYVRDYMKTFQLTTNLLEKGVFVNPIISPAVAPEDTLIRFSLMATHSKEQIDEAIDKIYKEFKNLEIGHH